MRRHSRPNTTSLRDPAQQLRAVLDKTADKLSTLPRPHQELTHQHCANLVKITNDLWRYSQLLMTGQINQALPVLQAIGKGLVESATLTTNHPTTSTEAMPSETQGSSASQDEESPQESTELYEHTAESLSMAIAEGVLLYPQLAEIRDAFNRLRKEVRSAATTWSLDENNEALSEHLAWFSDDKHGFNVLASRHLISQTIGGTPAMDDALQEAEQRLASVDALLRQAETKRQATRQQADTILARQRRFDECLAKLQEIRETIEKLPSKLVSSIVEQSGLLNQEELSTWQAYEARPYFHNLHKLRVEVSDWAEWVRRLLDIKPQLDERAVTVLDNARRYLEQLQAEPNEEQFPELLATPITDEHAVVTSPASSKQETTRIDEIYLLIVAVAGYRYCSHHNYVGMTISSVLGILVTLGKISDEEAQTHRHALVKRISSQSLTVSNRSNLVNTWKTADPQYKEWVYFRPTSKAPWLWRLVARAKQPALGIAEQLGLGEKEVGAAYEYYKALQQENRLQRRIEKS